ncbi:hypothetical protein LTR49_026717 [Elasticomyces elasticus]|nr:hypothetical protein LTR49_026717 [Elasticomyces elasticus]
MNQIEQAQLPSVRDPLGTLGRLPVEVRKLIYGYAIWLDQDIPQIILSPCVAALASTSSVIRKEWFDSGLSCPHLYYVHNTVDLTPDAPISIDMQSIIAGVHRYMSDGAPLHRYDQALSIAFHTQSGQRGPNGFRARFYFRRTPGLRLELSAEPSTYVGPSRHNGEPGFMDEARLDITTIDQAMMFAHDPDSLLDPREESRESEILEWAYGYATPETPFEWAMDYDSDSVRCHLELCSGAGTVETLAMRLTQPACVCTRCSSGNLGHN